MRRWRSLASLLVLSLLLVACGFHLRGSAALPPQMQTVELVGISSRSELGEEIVAALEESGGRVVSGAGSAELHVSGESQSRRLLSVGSGGRATEYEISYRFSYELRLAEEIRDENGQPVVRYRTRVAPQIMELQRDYAHNSANVLGSDDEEALLLREMRGLAVRQMLRQLQFELQAERSQDTDD